jgi:hypothetical protein
MLKLCAHKLKAISSIFFEVHQSYLPPTSHFEVLTMSDEEEHKVSDVGMYGIDKPALCTVSCVRWSS